MRSSSHSMQKLATNGNTENVARRCQKKTGRKSSPVKDWRDGRVVYCTGLENRRSARIRGFESHSLRQIHISALATRSYLGNFGRLARSAGNKSPTLVVTSP